MTKYTGYMDFIDRAPMGQWITGCKLYDGEIKVSIKLQTLVFVSGVVTTTEAQVSVQLEFK
jgi:hypothetical protein